MIFAAPVLAALASTLVVTNGGRSGGQRRRTGPIENPDEYYDADGLVTSWRLANAEETAAIKDLVESGALTGLKPGQIKRNYPMFARFSNSLISSKVSNLRRGLADAGARRAESKFNINFGFCFFAAVSTTTSPNSQWHPSFFLFSPSGAKTWWRSWSHCS